MARKRKAEIEEVEEIEIKQRTPKKRTGAYSKRKGNTYERKIAKELQELGYTGVVTSRSESKKMDDNKVDLIDTENILPISIQLKCTQNIPSYFKIQDECPIKDKPFCIIWNKQEKREVNCVSAGEVAMIPKDFLYELLKLYYEHYTRT